MHLPMHITRLSPPHAAEYRAVMIRASDTDPDAFTSTVAEREAHPPEWWAARVSDQPDPPELVIGAFEQGQLVGLAGLTFARRERTAHKATLFGMYVLPECRGRGIGRAVVRAVLDAAEAHAGIGVVQLTVTESNAPAVGLYTACGFVPFGVEPFAVRVGDRFLAKVHMWRVVGGNAV